MKKASSGTTTVKVSAGTKEKLKKEKKKRQLSSVDDVISAIVDELNASDIEDAVQDELENNDERPRQRRKKLVRDAFYTYKSVAERDGMVQYLTSLTVSEVDMVISRFQEMVQHSFSLPFFFFCHQCIWLHDALHLFIGFSLSSRRKTKLSKETVEKVMQASVSSHSRNAFSCFFNVCAARPSFKSLGISMALARLPQVNTSGNWSLCSELDLFRISFILVALRN